MNEGSIEIAIANALEHGLELRETSEGLTLCGNGMEFRGDFAANAKRLKRGSVQRELLVKAAKIKGFEGTPLAIDATAGMGEDALLLAAAGFEVKLYERNAVIAALLRDTMKRAEGNPELSEIVGRMELIEQDSITALENLGYRPDVILLDPMFPARQKSAAIKKKFQLLQKLEMPCADEEQLLQAAISAHPRKIVIKRPLKGPNLAGVKPSYVISGKAIRYDCISIA